MLLYETKEECCGCSACMNICPERAINMIADEEGFLYPEVRQESCIECDLCLQACAFYDGYKINNNYDQPLVYAVKHRNDEVRMNSSSGGMFTALSDYILSVNGIIYGAAFNEKFEVCHQKAVTVEDRNKFRGSKYVQSNLNRIFEDIKNELYSGKTVLFTGTPCQNAGLSVYLNGNYKNLYLCDIICHGTPSPLIFKKYIKYCEKKAGSSLTEYYCRYKGNGWHTHTEKAVYANGKEDSISKLSQIYKDFFSSLLILRPACHTCKFCSFSRPSDITIGDFWGIEKCMPDFDDNMGVSLVLINSRKGLDLFQKISENIYRRESNTKDCFQHNLYAPTPVSPNRPQFWRDYYDKGFRFVLNKYMGYGLTAKFKREIRKGLQKMRLLSMSEKLINMLTGLDR